MNVTLFGLGYVGTVTATCLAARGHHVVGIDTDAGKVADVNAGRPPVVEQDLPELLTEVVHSGALHATRTVGDNVRESDVSIVCVGTPSAANGSTDLNSVRRVVSDIGAALADQTRPHTVIIRSTVPPGTVDTEVVPLLESRSGRTVGDDLQVAMVPEFLREGTSVADFFRPPFLVIGGTPKAASVVRQLFAFLGDACSVHEVSTRAAESLKYACNSFHALKVSFANELARLYRILDIDSRQVMDVFVQDRQLNISPAYLRPGFAFGGSCLPKDLRSLLYLGRTSFVDLPLLQASLASNELLIRDVADRVLHAVEDGGGSRQVTLLGLSFKNNTDDLRESPNVALAEILIGKGLDVRVHDPVVTLSRLTGSNLRYVKQRLPHLGRVLHDRAEDAIRGSHVVIVSTADPDALAALRQAQPPVVLDLNGRLGTDVERLAGYQGVGW